MHNFNSRLMLTAVAVAALVAACGGGGGGGEAAVDPAAEVRQSVMKTIDFIKNMIASNSESSDPIAIDALTLAVDDTSEPAPL